MEGLQVTTQSAPDGRPEASDRPRLCSAPNTSRCCSSAGSKTSRSAPSSRTLSPKPHPTTPPPPPCRPLRKRSKPKLPRPDGFEKHSLLKTALGVSIPKPDSEEHAGIPFNPVLGNTTCEEIRDGTICPFPSGPALYECSILGFPVTWRVSGDKVAPDRHAPTRGLASSRVYGACSALVTTACQRPHRRGCVRPFCTAHGCARWSAKRQLRSNT